MSDSRWDAPLFLASGDVRQQANEPAQLTLVRRGAYIGTQKPLIESMAHVHQQHEGLGDKKGFERVVNQVASWVKDGRFPSDTLAASATSFLDVGQMEAIHAYTLETPRYYWELNLLFYNSVNAQHDVRLNVWQEFLFQLDGGLQKLSSYQKQKGHMARRLYRVAWIPHEDVEAYFQEGKEVVFKAPTSTSAVIQPGFYWTGVTSSFTGSKRCLLLEFDSVASSEALDIQLLSALKDEKEWLLPPFFRAVVKGRAEVTDSELGFSTDPRRPVLKVQLRGLRRLPPLQSVLDWHSGCSIPQLLGLTITLAAHSEDQGLSSSLTQALQQCEALASLVDANLSKCFHSAQLQTGGKIGVAYSVMSIAAGVMAGLLAATPVVGIVAGLVYAGLGAGLLADVLAGNSAKFQVQHGSRLEASARYWEEKVSELVPKIMEDLKQDPARMWKQVEEHMVPLQLELNVGIAQENTALRRLVSMLIEAAFVGQLLSMSFSFPGSRTARTEMGLEWMPQRAFIKTFQPDGWETPWLSPVVDSIIGANELLQRKRAGSTEQADQLSSFSSEKESGSSVPPDVLLFANLDLLRLRLSRTRVVLPFGPPDAGKTTILKKAFDLDLANGLLEEGRTNRLSFHQSQVVHLESSELLVGDVPGYGDSKPERNNVVRIMSNFALDEKLSEMMLILLVIRSGRDVQQEFDVLVEELARTRAKFMVIFTHADRRFADIHLESPKGTKRKDEAWLRACAKKIQMEDEMWIASHLPNLRPPVFYTCFSGAYSWPPPKEKEEEDSDGPGEGPKPWLKDAFHKNFQEVLRTPGQLRSEVLEHFGVDHVDA